MKNLFYLLIIFTACQSDNIKNTYNVRHKGALKNMMHKGDISAKADLFELAKLPHLYALGAIKNLKGEIQIFNGQPNNTMVEDGKAIIDNSFDKKATLLVWVEVENWITAPVPNNVKSYAQFEQFIFETAFQKGVDTDSPFPFLLQGEARSIDWHIINWKDGDKDHSHEKHIQSGLNGTLENITVNILGFYSRHHRTVFTHHTTNIHAHFRTENTPFGGHVDDLQLGENMILKLPISKTADLPNNNDNNDE